MRPYYIKYEFHVTRCFWAYFYLWHWHGPLNFLKKKVFFDNNCPVSCSRALRFHWLILISKIYHLTFDHVILVTLKWSLKGYSFAIIKYHMLVCIFIRLCWAITLISMIQQVWNHTDIDLPFIVDWLLYNFSLCIHHRFGWTQSYVLFLFG